MQIASTSALHPARWVIIDNGSSPENQEQIDRLVFGHSGMVETWRYRHNPENLGLPAAQNQAIDWIGNQEPEPYQIVLLDADTEVMPGWLTALSEGARIHPEIGLLGGARSPTGVSHPVYHHKNGRWYVWDKMRGDGLQGETVDFAGVLLTWNVCQRGIRFDPGYDFYDGHDQDMCFRVRSWGFTVVQVDAGILHYASSVMKSLGYQWARGGRAEWDALRAKNVQRFVDIWEPFLADHRPSIEAELQHVETMNRKLVDQAGRRKIQP